MLLEFNLAFVKLYSNYKFTQTVRFLQWRTTSVFTLKYATYNGKQYFQHILFHLLNKKNATRDEQREGFE